MAKPRAARTSNRSQSEDEEPSSFPALAPRISDQARMGRPPDTDEERTEVYLALISCKMHRLTNKECAAELGVSERTIVNYLADPYYGELRAAQSHEQETGARDLLSSLQLHAIKTLYDLTNPAFEKSGYVRFSAARALGEWGMLHLPPEEATQQGREVVETFLKRLTEEVILRTIPNAALPEAAQSVVVEADDAPASSDALPDWFEPVSPGGRLPAAS